MNRQELNKILEDHKLWLDSNGEEGISADLQETDLTGANLKEANLRYTNLQEANLRGADLKWTNLERADLAKANLEKADLTGADLERANLEKANLEKADLTGANLTGANLYKANLEGASLYKCIGNGKEIKTLQTEEYIITYTKDIIQIGCENHTHEEWKNFTDDEIDEMGYGALAWWKKYKDWLFQTIELMEGDYE